MKIVNGSVSAAFAPLRIGFRRAFFIDFVGNSLKNSALDLIAEDLTGQGHATREVGPEARVSIFVPLEK